MFPDCWWVSGAGRGPGVHLLCAGPVHEHLGAALHPHGARRGERAGGPAPRLEGGAVLDTPAGPAGGDARQEAVSAEERARLRALVLLQDDAGMSRDIIHTQRDIIYIYHILSVIHIL